MSAQDAVQSSVTKDTLRKKLERLTVEEQQAEQELRKIQEQIKSLEKSD